MMQSGFAGCADVHAGTQPDRIDAAQDLDLRGVVARAGLALSHYSPPENFSIGPPSGLKRISLIASRPARSLNLLMKAFFKKPSSAAQAGLAVRTMRVRSAILTASV